MLKNSRTNTGWMAGMMKNALLMGMFVVSVWHATAACGDDRLHKAAHGGDIDTVKTLLQQTVDPDERDAFGGTALHAAMFQQNADIIRLLIEHGFDVNAQGRSNGYTPLHDAVWANNLEAVKILLQHGAKTDIQAQDGLTPYAKAKQEGKAEIASYLEAADAAKKRYDDKAKTTYSENDVKAFVYQWFAGFDHQADIRVFTAHLPAEHVDMYFPDFPIKSRSDFERWYSNVIDSIQWNSHGLSNLMVSGDEANGFAVSLDINWKAVTYQGDRYDMNIHQDWQVMVDENRNFIIAKHAARVLEK